MVLQHGVEVELVHQESKKPFREHVGLDGEIYVEVEPDAEYVIRITSRRHVATGVRGFVDGESLHYWTGLGPGRATFLGIREVQNGCVTFRSLKFAKQPKPGKHHHHQQKAWGSPSPSLVEVRLYEFKTTTSKHRRDRRGLVWTGSSAAASSSPICPDPKKKPKKDLKSAPGQVLFSKKEARHAPGAFSKEESPRAHRLGAKIGTVKLHYRSAEGLIPVLQAKTKASSAATSREAACMPTRDTPPNDHGSTVPTSISCASVGPNTLVRGEVISLLDDDDNTGDSTMKPPPTRSFQTTVRASSSSTPVKGEIISLLDDDDETKAIVPPSSALVEGGVIGLRSGGDDGTEERTKPQAKKLKTADGEPPPPNTLVEGDVILVLDDDVARAESTNQPAAKRPTTAAEAVCSAKSAMPTPE